MIVEHCDVDAHYRLSIITDAIKYVQGKMDHLNTQEKKLLQDIEPKQQQEEENGEPDEEPAQAETTNGVF